MYVPGTIMGFLVEKAHGTMGFQRKPMLVPYSYMYLVGPSVGRGRRRSPLLRTLEIMAAVKLLIGATLVV